MLPDRRTDHRERHMKGRTMKRAKLPGAAFLLACIVGLVYAAGASPKPPAAGTGTTAASTKPAGVPDEVMKEIEAQFRPPDRDVAPADMEALQIRRLETVLKVGQEAEQKYPKAGDLHRVRGMMLRAAMLLALIRNDAASHKQLADVAGRMLSSDAPVLEKIQADFILTRSKIKPADGSAAKVDVAGEIREFAGRYAKTQAAGTATMHAILLAESVEQPKLKDELVTKLETEYLDQPNVRGFLRTELGRHPDVGRTFEAELKRLDGTKLSLPKDMLGKVVVIDFWATWCPACVDSLAKTKKLYDKYRNKGVEIIGISLDDDKATLESFLKANELGWIQTYSGSRADPVAAKYGIDEIPSVWVIDRTGKIVSDSALYREKKDEDGRVELVADPAKLEEDIEKALKEADTKPTTRKKD